ncbi:Centromere/kinetochore protein zw10 [Physocladia obscura]|uniref:Centromere/kinetochore protein zw10 n=1 Tax=Physocladia obscura TaxID=109957 RepID=A0AAD5SZ42_9FUNG|nr:Centromere/kinetochore protein zw10 [Physocladia obscura]
MFQIIFEATKFIHDSILGPDFLENTGSKSEWTPEHECFVQILSPFILTELLSDCLIPSIPDNSNDMATYGGFLDAVRAFDKNMKDAHMLFADSCELLDFVAGANLAYARKRKSQLLMEIRKIIESEDQNTFEVDDATERGSIRSLYAAKTGGVKAVSEMPQGKGANSEKHGIAISETSFRLPKCQVSVQAQTLVEQAYQTLNEALLLDNESAIELFYCTRDIFDLYRAVMPILHADNILNSPARAIIFYNDCEYFSHHLLTLGYQYKDKLPEPANKFATFLDMIPYFRNLGEKYFRSQLRTQRDILREFVTSANGFSTLTDDNRFEAVEKSIKKALSHLNGLSRVWKPLLAVDTYLSAMGLLVDTLLESMIAEASKLSAISKEESHQLRYIMGLANKVENFFEIKSSSSAKVSEKVDDCFFVFLRFITTF